MKNPVDIFFSGLGTVPKNKFSGLKIHFQYYILDNNLLTRCFGTVKFDASFWPVLVILKKNQTLFETLRDFGEPILYDFHRYNERYVLNFNHKNGFK